MGSATKRVVSRSYVQTNNMKYVILVACTGLVLIAGCRKITAVPNAGLSGTWELTRIEANLTQNYPAGNGNLLKFSDDSSYQMYTNGTLLKSGRFSIIYDTTMAEATCTTLSGIKFSSRIIYDSAYGSPKTFSNISGNVLTVVSAGCFALDDGSIGYYTKK